jgi:hypothetical protein
VGGSERKRIDREAWILETYVQVGSRTVRNQL